MVGGGGGAGLEITLQIEDTIRVSATFAFVT